MTMRANGSMGHQERLFGSGQEPQLIYESRALRQPRREPGMGSADDGISAKSLGSLCPDSNPGRVASADQLPTTHTSNAGRRGAFSDRPVAFRRTSAWPVCHADSLATDLPFHRVGVVSWSRI